MAPGFQPSVGVARARESPAPRLLAPAERLQGTPSKKRGDSFKATHRPIMIGWFVACERCFSGSISRPMSDLHPLEKILRQRIAIIDGAMGTTIRSLRDDGGGYSRGAI